MKEYITRISKSKILPGINLILIWLLLSIVVDNEIIIPGIGVTIENLFRIVSSDDFYLTILWTFFRSILVFVISTILSIILASLSSVSVVLYNHIKPVLSMMASIPILAIIILALIWLDVEMVSIFIGIIFILPIQFEKVLGGINSIDVKLLEMAKIYKVCRWVKIKDIYIPIILSSIFFIANSTLGSALKMVIAGEVLSQPQFSIGSNLILQKTYLNTPGVFAWIIIILILSKGLSILMSLFQRRLIRNSGVREI